VPTIMADTVHATISGIPASCPRVAGYVTGTPDVRWTTEDWARFPHAGHVRIDQEPGLGNPLGSDCADVETDAKTINAALDWLRVRSSRHWWSLIYLGDHDDLPAMRKAVEAAGLAKVQYWICNPALSLGEAEQLIEQVDGGIVAVQWATPESNPETLVPGTHSTLKAANVDLSTTADAWFLSAH
jgi:hypothetical protein